MNLSAKFNATTGLMLGINMKWTGLDHILFGSTAEKVVRKSPRPVLTVRLPGRRFLMP
jgi:hypothetical protein